MARVYPSPAPPMPVDRWRHPYSAVLSWLGILLPVLAAVIVYMAVRPPSVDLAAQLFRCELFASNGFLAWNNYWYGGHYLLGYSLLFPPLGAAVGASAVGGLRGGRLDRARSDSSPAATTSRAPSGRRSGSGRG